MSSISRSTSSSPLPDWPPATVTDFIVSFPKSGRTWLRVLLAAAIALHRQRDLNALVGSWLDSDLLDIDGRTLLFSHALANRMEHDVDDMRAYAEHIKFGRRILLLRDPRDTVISYYFQRTRRPRKDTPEPVPHDLPAFVRHPALGIDRVIDFFNIWIAAIRAGGPAMIVSYEDLHRIPQDTLHRTLSFFGIELRDASVLDEAIDFADFSNMRKMESGEHFVRSKKLRAYDPADVETFKTREGKVGGYRSHLAPAEIEFIESRVRDRLDPAGGYREPGVPATAGARSHEKVDVAAAAGKSTQ